MFHLPWGIHVLALFVFCFVGFVLSLLLTFSTPFISPIAFLTVPTNGGSLTFGSFGWCSTVQCSGSQLAYEYSPLVNSALTGAMMLWPIAGLLMLFTVLSILPLLLVHEASGLRFLGNKPFFMLTSLLAALFVSLAWVLSLLGWNIVRRSYVKESVDARLGPAIWMGLVATIFIAGVVGIGWPDHLYRGAVPSQVDPYAYQTPPLNEPEVVQTTTRRVIHQTPSPAPEYVAEKQPAPILIRQQRSPSVPDRPAGVPLDIPLPPQSGDGYYTYKRTTREVVPM